jgi:uncharacterized membrane protein YhiD involved in acid resistance
MSMFDFLKAPLVNGPQMSVQEILLRLVIAALFGGAVALVYRRSRPEIDVAPTFPPTLVLLAVLIAMVTQVIGDNVARAFSLVGALSIVRFRTVVRDTQDTAFVILAVVVGMSIGASAPWVAVIGIGVVACVAFLMRRKPSADYITGRLPLLLRVRVGLGHDVEPLLGGTLDVHFSHRRMHSMETAKQGVSIDVAYEAKLREPGTPEQLVKALNRIEGVQSVRLERCPSDVE